MAGQAPHRDGVGATPPVSTPLSAAHAAAYSPYGPRSSPQAVKKSPATTTSATVNNPSVPAVNYDSPAAFGGLNLAGVDLSLDHVNIAAVVGLGKSNEDERAKRFEDVLGIISQSKGVISESGLERLVKGQGLECVWDDGMGEGSQRTAIVGGYALELLITIANDRVQSVSLAFPESGDVVNKHAPQAGQILLDDLKLRDDQSPLTKRADGFAANFERLAILDRLSTIPGLNLYQAVAGVYLSLERLHDWEMQKLREDPILASKSDDLLNKLVLCTRCGVPHMNENKVVGLTLDYWKEGRLVPSIDQHKTWRLHVACGPLRDISVRPVRLSDNWLPVEVEKSGLPDWQEPEATLIHPQDQSKAPEVDGMPDPTLLGPRLPEVVFTATFDPPIHISYNLWEQMRQLGCVPPPSFDLQPKTYDNLLFPVKPGEFYNAAEPRVITRTREVGVQARGNVQRTLNTHVYSLYAYRPNFGATLSEISFSHPREIISILPWLRQYAFLSTLLQNSFGDGSDSASHPPRKEDISICGKTTSYPIDVTLSMQANPHLQIVFPFRDKSVTVVAEIRENGLVHIETQNILDEHNSVAPDGRQRRQENLGTMLEVTEHIGKWVDYIRTRWA